MAIPAYNRAEMLPRAIASVRAQTHAPAEIVVVDDKSADDTHEVAVELGARVIRHEQNRGEGAARNTAIEAATQPWIALLDSDDEWMPGHLEHVFGLRNGHVLVAAATLLRGAAPLDGRIYGPVGTHSIVLDSPADVAYPVHKAPASSALMQREAVIDAGGFDPSLRLCADFDMSLRLLEVGTGIASPVIGSIYHMHERQLSRNDQQMHDAHLDVLRQYGGRPWCTGSLLRRSDGVIAWDSFRRAMRDRDRREALRGLAHIFSHPDRLRGTAGILAWRIRMRRMSDRLSR